MTKVDEFPKASSEINSLKEDKSFAMEMELRQLRKAIKANNPKRGDLAGATLQDMIVMYLFRINLRNKQSFSEYLIYFMFK